MSYTPTPYRQDPNEGLFIFAKDNAKPIAKVTSKSTAAFIVHACNAHYDLVEALEMLLQDCEEKGRSASYRQAESALKLACDE